MKHRCPFRELDDDAFAPKRWQLSAGEAVVAVIAFGLVVGLAVSIIYGLSCLLG